MGNVAVFLRLLHNEVVGPRDWYEIKHCKTGRGKSYFGVRVCIWKEGPHESWPDYFDAENVHLTRALAEVLKAIEEGKQDA